MRIAFLLSGTAFALLSACETTTPTGSYGTETVGLSAQQTAQTAPRQTQPVRNNRDDDDDDDDDRDTPAPADPDPEPDTSGGDDEPPVVTPPDPEPEPEPEPPPTDGGDDEAPGWNGL